MYVCFVFFKTTVEALDERGACRSSKPLLRDQYSHKKHRWGKVDGGTVAGLIWSAWPKGNSGEEKTSNFCLFTCFHFYSPLGTKQANWVLFKNRACSCSHTPSFRNQNLGNFVLDFFYEYFQAEKKMLKEHLGENSAVSWKIIFYLIA